MRVFLRNKAQIFRRARASRVRSTSHRAVSGLPASVTPGLNLGPYPALSVAMDEDQVGL